MGDSRVQQFVPIKKVGNDISPKVPNDAINFQRVKPEINVETLAATKTLAITDLMAQWLDPDGSDRDVVLPAEADSTHLMFILLNDADGAGEDLVVENDGASTIATLGPGMSGIFSCDGTDWKWENAVDFKYDAIAQQTIFPLVNDAASPTIAFGNGDTGFYESTDGTIAIAIEGNSRYVFNNTYMGIGGWAGLLYAGATNTVPNIVPQTSDADTGIGRAAADQLSLIAGGVEALRLIEDTTIELRIAKNDSWLSSLNYAGAAAVNMLKVNVDDEIDVGATMIVGQSEAVEDAGAITWRDMPVSATPAAGDEMSFTDKIDGDNILTVGAFADGAGGVTGHFVKNHGAAFINKTDAGAADYNPAALTSDRIITVDTTAAARAVTISTEDRDSGSASKPRVFIIKDIAGNAAAHNITVSLETSGTIDGAATFVISSDYGAVTLAVDGTNGYII